MVTPGSFIRTIPVTLAIGWLFWLGTSAALAEEGRRLALIIGNSDYENVTRLPNPTKDARGIAAALQRIGFEVDLQLDLDVDQMKRVTHEFAKRSEDAEISLFYYAGHGVQVEGRNYLLPINADVVAPRDLVYETVQLDQITAQLGHSGAKLKLVLLDACRDNPLASQIQQSQYGHIVGSGLASTQGVPGMLIAYATAPDTVALDGAANHSPFTQALLEWIDYPGVEVGTLFRRVRERVMDITQNQQVPWVEEAVIGEYYLNGRESDAEEEADAERMFWEHVQSMDDVDQRLTALQRYMLVFPEGERFEEARRMRRLLTQSLADAGTSPPKSDVILQPAAPDTAGTAVAKLTAEGAEPALAVEADSSPAALCQRYGNDPLFSDGASDGWIEDRRFPLAPRLHRMNEKRAIEACQEAVDQDGGNPKLQALLGRSLTAAKRWREALWHLRLAVDEGNPVAMYVLGGMFRDGQQVAAHLGRALDLFEKSAKAGHLGAAFELGLAYRNGQGRDRDIARARHWLEVAADGGYDWAQYELGRFWESGAMGHRDAAMALQWWQKAAEQGNGRAARAAGLLLMTADGVAGDLAEASRLLRLAVVQGETQAELPLAQTLLTLGGGVSVETEASRLLERAALRREGEAALMLGELHADGLASFADPALAAYWLASTQEMADREVRRRAATTFSALPRSAVVEAIQRALIDLGFDPGGTDGVMGQKTQSALVRFKNANSGAAVGGAADASIETLASLIGASRW